MLKGGCTYWMPGVIVREQEPFEKALKRFKKACEKAGIISDMKKHQHFEKPSERKKRKINAAKRKRIKLEKAFG
jgi:small subunit ribosomal protein S21